MSSSALGQGRAREHPPATWQTTARRLLPPIERREFWAIQALVLAIAAAHTWVEYQHVLDEHSAIYLLPTTLYLIPIVLAAVNFGLRGAVLTAVWSALLVSPNVILWHEGLEKAGEVIQVAWITIAAVFVGSRVDRERVARLEAERREAARRISEERYRAIVDSVAEPIIVLDDRERILEANTAAARLLGSGPESLRGRQLDGPVGEQIADALRASSNGGDGDGGLQLGEPPRRYELLPMRLDGPAGPRRTQLLLRDVTVTYERERGLEGIARQTLIVREEEQRRIARELHDGPLQSVIQLWRSLDTMAERAPAPYGADLLSARDTADDVAAELRRFSRDLRPSVLDDLGIVPAIRNEVESFGRRVGIAAGFRASGAPARLDTTTELALLRIAQEALRNTERHSGATSVEVELMTMPNLVHLVIRDDGIGMPTVPVASQLLSDGHLGLIGIQERARMVGGRARFISSSQGGMSVEVEVPRSGPDRPSAIASH